MYPRPRNGRWPWFLTAARAGHCKLSACQRNKSPPQAATNLHPPANAGLTYACGGDLAPANFCLRAGGLPGRGRPLAKNGGLAPAEINPAAPTSPKSLFYPIFFNCLAKSGLSIIIKALMPTMGKKAQRKLKAFAI